MRIRIVGTPSSKLAPEEIMRCWVGIELNSIGREELKDKDVLIGCVSTGNLGGYLVFGELAFQTPETHNKEAYDWWAQNHPELFRRTLVFRVEVCEVISL